MNFYNRKNEISLLQEEFDGLNFGSMNIIYGRRRVGKTELIKQFLNGIPGKKMYFYVDLLEKQSLLASLSKNVQEQLSETVFFDDFDDFLIYLGDKSTEGFVLVIDEFQRFLEISPGLITQLQNAWDSNLKTKKIMLILVGSSMGMIQKITNSRAGALYGRGRRIKISPFRYVDFRLMFNEMSEEEKIKLYSVFGGTPYYLEKIKNTKGDIYSKIYKHFLLKDSELYEEPKNFLEYENVRMQTKYNSIMQSVSKGKQTIKEISDYTGIETNTIPAYIARMDTLLDLIEKRNPLLGKERLGRYEIKDNFFSFWYRFIFPNQTAINIGNTSIVEDYIRENLSQYVGRKFEGICREMIILNINRQIQGYTMDFEEIGGWWNRSGEEIDIVAYNKRAKKILLVEVKWTNSNMDIDTVNGLIRKSKLIGFKGEYKFMFISKNGFTEKAIEKMNEFNAIRMDINDLEKTFNKIG